MTRLVEWRKRIGWWVYGSGTHPLRQRLVWRFLIRNYP